MDHPTIDWAAVDAALTGSPPAAPSPPQETTVAGRRRAGGPLAWLAIAGAVSLVLLAGTAMLVAATPAPAIGLQAADPVTASASPDASDLLVDVEGAVRHPGLVRLPAGSRVADAIAASGGYSGAVDAAATASQLDLADPLQDGAKILVPQRGPVGAGGSAPAAPAGKVDLNRATAAELDALPGIGPVTAAKIIASRQQQPFRRVDDLRTRKLVGAATFTKLQALVTV